MTNTTTPDVRVNSAALQLALNALRRSGDHAVADALATTAIREVVPATSQDVPPEYLSWLAQLPPYHRPSGNEAWNAGVAWAQQQQAINYSSGWQDALSWIQKGLAKPDPKSPKHKTLQACHTCCYQALDPWLEPCGTCDIEVYNNWQPKP